MKKIGINILLSFLLLTILCTGCIEALKPVPAEKLQEVILNMHDQERISLEIERRKQ